MSTSGVSSGRRPNFSALKTCRSVKRPSPVALSGVRLRGRVVKQGFAPGVQAHEGGILNSWSGTITPASQPFAAGLENPPWQSPQAWVMTENLPRVTSPGDAGERREPAPSAPAVDRVHAPI